MDGWAQLVGTLGVAAMSSLGTLGVARIGRKPAARNADAAVQKAIADGFTALAARYEARDKALVERVTSLENAVHELNGHIVTLEEVLRANSLPVPPRVVPFPLKAQA